jgi:sugar lactone lactonase YvrE
MIKNFAGTGNVGYSGDGGAATRADLNGPSGLAADDVGNLYIADSGNNRVRKVSREGIITTMAGNGSRGYAGEGGRATEAQLNDPEGVALDRTGGLYIADGGNNRIRKVSPSGIISTIAGNGTSGYTGDGGPAQNAQLKPSGIAVDAAGNVFVSEPDNDCIRALRALKDRRHSPSVSTR